MKIDKACVDCIVNQSYRVCDAIDASEELRDQITSTIKEMSKEFSYAKNPPEIASDVYEKMALMAEKEDLYREAKALSTQKALSFVPLIEEKLLKSADKLLTATKIAVAGNVIDLAAVVEFDLEEELSKVFETDFAHDDFELLREKLKNAKSVLVIGDNVGEHIFDYIFVRTLREIYPSANYSYMVRGNPIINDVTMKEANEAGFDKICSLVDSGVNTPGFSYNRANVYSKELFDRVDLVITKGMGNYECLSETHRSDLCFLLKVKCEVVASSLERKVGDIICKMI
ncbi:MAG: ARMT1-like domain-containing protein [Sulfurimonas sp.]|uniref:damage-control phosphatase ARMT1 family protein n=1 Tax=Sulfurimonas sp. TaxID=2022749 RepID=UPI0025F202AC|nr:ARMT1-like domain-containing protein [Sulfurimonas sp.]MCK9490578.1 ARMT1-like domain-containing protein [Sulfurimonas sp.]